MNNKLFELVYKSGPGGDQCTTYNIKFNKDDITVEEFLSNLDPQEYVYVYIEVKNPETYNLPYATNRERYKNIKIEYDCGYIKSHTDSIYKNYLNNYIDVNWKNWANGGWSAMDYWIKIK